MGHWLLNVNTRGALSLPRKELRIEKEWSKQTPLPELASSQCRCTQSASEHKRPHKAAFCTSKVYLNSKESHSGCELHTGNPEL